MESYINWFGYPSESGNAASATKSEPKISGAAAADRFRLKLLRVGRQARHSSRNARTQGRPWVR